MTFRVINCIYAGTAVVLEGKDEAEAELVKKRDVSVVKRPGPGGVNLAGTMLEKFMIHGGGDAVIPVAGIYDYGGNIVAGHIDGIARFELVVGNV